MSNKANIEKSLKSLILDDGKEFVSMLSGEWGIGKTHFWNKFKENNLKEKDVVYISLFGKNSLQDIETEIVTKLYRYTKGLKKYSKHFDTVSNLGSKAMGLPINVSMGSILSLFSPNDFKNIIICFDDFERLSEKTSLKDVMGLISQFKEQKECKVIMILNEQELNKLSDIDGKKHDEIFALYKEKIVDYNFHYMPSQEELFAASKADIEKIEFCDHQPIYDFFQKINLKNIRIMKQALYQLEHFSFIKEYGLDDKVVKEFVEIALNLFIFKAKCNYNYKEFNKLRSYNSKKMWEDAIQKSTEKEFITIEKYEKCIDCCDPDNYTSTNGYSQNKDFIEKNIYNFIDSHTLNKQELKGLLKENNQNLLWYDIRNKISELHTRLYTDFSTQNNEIAKQLFDLLNEHKDDMCHLFLYSNYRPFIEHINKFLPDTSTESLEEKIAKHYIDFYIDNHNHDKYGPTDSGSHLDLIVSDYKWAHTYRNEYKRKTLKVDPNEALPLIKDALDDRYLSEDTVYKLGQIPAKDYEKLIKDNPDLIQPLVRFLRMPDSKDTRKNIVDALKSLKDESNDYAWKVEYIAKNANIKLEDENNETL